MSLLTKTGKAHVSYSALDGWLQCGERYRLERIVGAEQGPAYWFAGGTSVHTGTEWLDAHLWAEPGDYNGAVEIGVAKFHETFEKELDAGAGQEWRAGGRATKAFPNKEDAAWWAVHGAVMVQNYGVWRENNEHLSLAAFVASDDGQIPGIEIPIDFEMTGGVKVRGYIDRVFIDQSDNLLIVDLKSGSREPASPLQLAIYRIGLEKCYGVKANLGSFYMTRKGELSGIEDVSRLDEAMIARWFRDFTQAVENDIFIPHVTSMCGTCSVQNECYAYSPSAVTPDFSSDLGA